MARKPAQAARIGSLTTALGKDKLVLTRFEGTEGLSELFEYRVEALSSDPNLNFNPAIGEKCCITLKTHSGTDRHFHGILVATQWAGKQVDLYAYRLVIRPWFWLLTRSSNCRIFKDKNVPDIIKEVFAGHGGYATCQPKLRTSYPELKYCVQYRESDFDFVSRLMEEFGIYYYFDHSDSQHLLVLSDSLSSHSAKKSGEALKFRWSNEARWRTEDFVYSWVAERCFNTGKVIFNDYDFKNPTGDLLAEKEKGGGYQNDKLTHYDYPGRYKEKGLGMDLAQVRLEAEQAKDNRRQAAGDAAHCAPGSLVTLSGHSESSQNGRYIVIRAVHTYTSATYETADGQGEEIYNGHYEFLPSDIPYRAPQITPKPRIYGPQTAVVVGSGEIDVDEDGCIMVQFHWDRDKKESRRVRLAQVWAGRNWGGIYIPRVGMEAVVQFVEGDPDRPLVIGAVYNADNPPPYDLPGEKTLAGIKSKTDGGSGYNEFVMDDTCDHEKIRMHAQMDMEGKIENDEKRDVGNVYSLEAGTVKPTGKIELKIGQSSIVMDAMSITIKSQTIKIEAGILLDETSPVTKVNGDATLILKGGVVLIN